jgi:type I restriction enzyme S subunit
MPWISISDMGTGSAYLFETSEGLTLEAIKRHNVKVVPANTVLLSFKLTVGRVSITTTEMCTNEAIAHFVTDDDSLREYTYCYLKNFHYDELGSTSSISKAINSKIVKAMPFVKPSDDIVKAFHKVMKPIFDQIFTKQKQIQNLSQSRDRLLPKLMNGELEV